jgi:hypothetical protein
MYKVYLVNGRRSYLTEYDSNECWSDFKRACEYKQ